MSKYTNARYPEKINDLVDNDGNLNPNMNSFEVLAFIDSFVHLKKKENGDWYFDPKDFEESKFPETQRAIIFYSFKRESSSPLEGGCAMLFNNNTMQLCNFPDDTEYMYVNTVTNDGITTLTIDECNLSYARIIVVNMPIQVHIDLSALE